MWHPCNRKQSYGLAHIGSNVFKFFDFSWSSLLQEFCRNFVRLFCHSSRRIPTGEGKWPSTFFRNSSRIQKPSVISDQTKALFYRWKNSWEFGISFFVLRENIWWLGVSAGEKKLRIMYTRQSMACGRVDTSRKMQRACGNHFESNLLCACGGNFENFLLKNS